VPRDPIAIIDTGLVTSVGLSAPATCAAIRAGVTNPTETQFVNQEGDRIIAHTVGLDTPWRGRTKLVKMAAMAVDECLARVPREDWTRIPLLVCVAEPDRPGRLEGLDDELFPELEEELGAKFAPESAIVAHGRVSAMVALRQARRLLHQHRARNVVIAAADTFVIWHTLAFYQEERRLLTGEVSNGFIPGEGAGALLVALPSGQTELLCTGVGFAYEKAHIRTEEPLRGDGLTSAIKEALADAGCEMHHMDFRITDLSGEQYYFKEASLALARTLRQLKEEFDIWHPAECIGESGALAGVAVLAVAHAACHKAYAPGPNILMHMANDEGQRAAAIAQFTR
jgi:3-oxoacyl-[acyl-carrier-protein] synthase-1